MKSIINGEEINNNKQKTTRKTNFLSLKPENKIEIIILNNKKRSVLKVYKWWSYIYLK